ncbi:MAG: hypothetical protein U0136_19840 [Bdellovibrionota bacterium]
MARLTLRLTGDANVLLKSSAFYDSSLTGEVRVTVDDAPAGEHRSLTPGLQAFLLLCLHTAAAGRRAFFDSRGGRPRVGLRGGPESSAASLAAMIDARGPSLLHQLFGVDQLGRSKVGRALSVERFEERTMSYVAVSFNPSCLLPNEIQIIWNGVGLDDPDTLEGLATMLERTHAAALGKSKHTLSATLDPFLRSIYLRELEETVAGRYRPVSEPSTFGELTRHPALSQLGVFSPLARLCEPRSRLPLIRSRASTARRRSSRDNGVPLRVAVPPSLAGALAIFRFLELRPDQDVVIDYDYSYSSQVARTICESAAERRPDLCVLALPTALRERRLHLARNGAFAPVMWLPETTHRIIAPNVSRSHPSSHRYHFMVESPGTGYVYFRELVANRTIDPKRTVVEHTEPSHLFSTLAERDPQSRAIIWFPHYDLNCYLNDCRLVDSSKRSLAHQGIVLLASARLRRDEALLIRVKNLIASAWRTLSESANARRAIVDSLIADKRYVEVILRSGGLSEKRAYSEPRHPWSTHTRSLKETHAHYSAPSPSTMTANVRQRI